MHCKPIFNYTMSQAVGSNVFHHKMPRADMICTGPVQIYVGTVSPDHTENIRD